MELDSDERELKAAGAEPLDGGRLGLRIRGWEIESRKLPILNSSLLQQTCLRKVVLERECFDLFSGLQCRTVQSWWEQKLQTSHFPEMIFGESSLVLKHVNSGIKIHFNAFDALLGWKQESLPPVEVPAAAQWKFRSKPDHQVILDYDYTFTTPYCGTDSIEANDKPGRGARWEDCNEKIDMVALASKEPILFYDEVILYEDELADSGVSLLTVKVRVMPSGWFLLLRFWLRVDGVLMRLRETRMHCLFGESSLPIILREICWREATFQALSLKGYPTDSAAYNDPGIICKRLPIIMHKTQKLSIT